MLHKSILLPLLLSIGSISSAQRPIPTPYVGNSVNFIRTWTAIAPTTDTNTLMNGNLPQTKEASQYFDGLGRPLQMVLKKGSLVTDPNNPASSANAVDIVSGVVYDEFGREQYKYLPSPANNTGGNLSMNDGLFKPNAFQQQQAFYNNYLATQTGEVNASKNWAYGQTIFEASPLNRVLETFAPGNSWAGTAGGTDEANHRSVKAKYCMNTATDVVRLWNVTEVAGAFGTYSTTSTYQADKLYKNLSVDEHGKQVIEFKDKDGLIILKKVQLTAAGDNGSGADHTGWLCTYYMYDNLRNLRCVVQPEGVKALPTGSWSLTQTMLDEQCFRYEYDSRNRMITKKVPGAGAVNMVYDARDRLVMTQDAVQKAAGQYLVTKYDDMNRPVETGTWTSSTDAATHRTNAKTTFPYPATTGTYEILTNTYYDNYSFPAANPFINAAYDNSWDSNNLLPASNTVWPYPQANTTLIATKGLVTGTRTLVLGTSTYLYTANIYDAKARVIQARSTNATGGVDVVTTQYSWAGQPLVMVQSQQKAGANAQTTVTVTKQTYDDLGRLVKTEKKFSNTLINSNVMSGYVTISTQEYDALGQLKTKTVGSRKDPATGTYYTTRQPLESLRYDYNIRGWMLGMNRDYAKDGNDNNYFGFDLGYDKTDNGLVGGLTYAAAQYNGNIEGMVWKCKGDKEKRKYDFSYDGANRLLKADFNQYTSGTFNKTAGIDFSMQVGDGSMATTAYDDNGNILAMTQKGLKITGSSVIDQLSYTYLTGANRLAKVTDAITVDNKLGDFKDGTNTGTNDYDYDANGNLKLDNNKNISALVYNYLNLPQTITVTGKGIISYLYDATGNKLEKKTADNTISGKTVTTTTHYIAGFIYESKTTVPANIPNDDYAYRLQFWGMEEGRTRALYDNIATPNMPSGFVYDYMLKDHLGNVRVVLTEELKQDKYPTATLETAKVATEKGYYDIQDANVVDKSAATGITNYVNDNGIGDNPSDPAFETTNSAKLYKLNSNTAKTGLGITLKVMAGDRIDVFGKSYYFQNNPGSGSNNSIPILDLLTAFLTAPAAAANTAVHGAVTAATINIPAGIAGINTMMSQQSTQNNAAPLKPRAFINVLFFDEQFKAVDFKVSIVGDNSAVKDHFSELQNLVANKSGFVYIYCSNESPVNVYFDNLQVVHTRGALLEENHYYPFGLTMAGISDKALKSQYAENKYRWNKGSELQNKEFSDGSGLEMYETHLRELDPQLGRWWQIDPVFANGVDGDDEVNGVIIEGLKSQSPYASMDNNPIRLDDPNGDCPSCLVEMAEAWEAAGSGAWGTAATTGSGSSGSTMGSGEAMVAATGAFFSGAWHGMQKAWNMAAESSTSTTVPELGASSQGEITFNGVGYPTMPLQPAGTIKLSTTDQDALNKLNQSLGILPPSATLAANPSVPTNVQAKQAAGQTAAGHPTDVHGNKLGPSGKPQVNTVKHSSRKSAKDAARNEGKKPPVNHTNPKKGDDHYHATDENGEKLPNSTHHEYPK